MTARDGTNETPSTPRLPPDLIRAVGVLLQDLAAKEITAGSLKAGETFPEFELPDSEGRLVSFSELIAKGPLVVSFFRGDWCPYCTAELHAYQAALPEFRRIGAQLVAVTPDTRAAFVSAKRRHNLAYQILSDVDYGLALACGILFRLPEPLRVMYREAGIDLAERHGTSGCFLPFPATYIIDRTGVVRHAEIDPDFRRRMEPAQVLEILKGLAPA